MMTPVETHITTWNIFCSTILKMSTQMMELMNIWIHDIFVGLFVCMVFNGT